MLQHHFRGGIIRAFAASACLLCAAGSVEAQDDSIRQARVTLPSGDIITGDLVAQTDEAITIRNDAFGEVTIPRANIESVTLLDPPAPEAEAAPPAEEALAPVETAPESPWEIRFELGASGSRGNTERDNFRSLLAATRDTDSMNTLLSADYRQAQEDGETTENRLFLRARNEWKIANSKWSYFVLGDADVDEFKDYDYRLAAFTGAVYTFYDLEEQRLKTRMGLGASKEFGSENDDVVPEGLLGVDYMRKVNDRLTFTALAEYFPNLEDTREFRARAEAALEIALNGNKTWLLRISVEDRYESEVEAGTEKNDFFYGASLLFVF